MTPNVENLGPCNACGGKLFPFILCESCGAATILREARQLENQATCPECGARNPWQLICDQCHSRFRAPAAEEAPPSREPGDEAGDGRGSCGPSKATNQWRV